MRTNIFTFLAMAGAVSAVKIWKGMDTLPDGTYIGTVAADGETVEMLPVDENGIKRSASEASAPLVFHAEEDGSATLEKRWSGGCHGPELDHGSTDTALAKLKVTAGHGYELCSSLMATRFKMEVSGGVGAYYCINSRSGKNCGNLDIPDVDHAMREMDQWCGSYQGSWYGWPGTYEIVGKCALNTRVCIGN